MYRNVLIITDIEGSSGCWDRQGGRFMTRQWRRACVRMSQDVGVVTRALFAGGAEAVHIVDFHRTAYNLLPQIIDRRARISQGYSKGPIPGIGSVEGAEAVLFIGMHAASGSAGFLAHTLTSRIASLRVNGRLLSEVELFASVLAPYQLKPVFFTGCPVACRQAREAIPGIETYAIDKSGSPADFDIRSWRKGLALAAQSALQVRHTVCPDPGGPLYVEIDMHDKTAAVSAAKQWHCDFDGEFIRFSVPNASELYLKLIRICYFNRLTARFLRPSLFMYRLLGRIGWLTVWMAAKRCELKSNTPRAVVG
jgi:D-amino peptidase